jgi:siroheme synthase
MAFCLDCQSEASYPSSCPAAVVERASLKDQRVIIGTVSTLASMAEAYEVKAPATVIFGRVVSVLHGDVHGIVVGRGQ